LRGAQLHTGAGRAVAHPAGQLAPASRPVLDQDDIEMPTPCALAHAQPAPVQRVPRVLDRGEAQIVCGMTGDLVTT
jgi:hypothetical protein